jgi:hypothetical protein
MTSNDISGSSRDVPEFTLPEIGSGRSLGPRDFLGKRTVLYMWASW